MPIAGRRVLSEHNWADLVYLWWLCGLSAWWSCSEAGRGSPGGLVERFLRVIRSGLDQSVGGSGLMPPYQLQDWRGVLCYLTYN